ncbi:MAG: hypothetical protein U0516_04525 [Candidatus Saccharibacteria bacterium]
MANVHDPDGYSKFLRGMHDRVHYNLKALLLSLADDEIFSLWEHICSENFRPDEEFGRFNLEDRMTVDEFMDVFAETVDERRRKLCPQPELA